MEFDKRCEQLRFPESKSNNNISFDRNLSDDDDKRFIYIIDIETHEVLHSFTQEEYKVYNRNQSIESIEE